MKPLVLGIAAGLLLLTGCEPGRSPVGPPPSTGATAGASAVPTDGTSEPAPNPELVLAPGKAGPFTIGMTSETAIEQGLVREPGDSECGLTPTGGYRGFSVQFADTDTGDVLFGVLVKNPEAQTAEGIGVGDSVEELTKVYGTRLKKTTGEYGETTHVLTEGNMAIGFTEGEGDDVGKIFAVDVFQADSPVLWDGC